MQWDSGAPNNFIAGTVGVCNASGVARYFGVAVAAAQSTSAPQLTSVTDIPYYPTQPGSLTALIPVTPVQYVIAATQNSFVSNGQVVDDTLNFGAKLSFDFKDGPERAVQLYLDDGTPQLRLQSSSATLRVQ